MTRLLNSLTAILFIASIALRNPLVFLVAVLLALVAGVTELWGRYALAGVTYQRRLGTARMFVGEETDLWIEITNAKPLPLAWLKANDQFPSEMQLVKGTKLPAYNPTRLTLANLVSLRFYERVRKHYRVRAIRRGALEFGPVELSSGDLFGMQSRQAAIEQTDELIVYPKVVPIAALGLHAAHPFGDAKTPRRVSEDPLRLMSVRAYAPGDSPRTIHWKATARRRTLQTKMFEPGAERSAAIFLDLRTAPPQHPGIVPVYLEFALTAAASIARYVLDQREGVGLYINGWRKREWNLVRLLPSRRPARWMEILDTLARVNDLASLPLDDFIRAEMSTLPFGVSVIAISASLSDNLYAALYDLKRKGHPVTLLAIGEESPPDVPADLRTFWIGGRETYERLTQLDLSVPQ
jgi:uncharacterized protein (DUF58 family)